MELNQEPGLPPSVSITEGRVGKLVAAGYLDSEIANRLLLTPQAVEWSIAKLCRTLQAGSRSELVMRLAALRPPSQAAGEGGHGSGPPSPEVH
jgi:DNA-binding NarL/FixJ family response regulator